MSRLFFFNSDGKKYNALSRFFRFSSCCLLFFFFFANLQARFLQAKFPDLIVEGGTYPAPPILQFVSNLVALAQLGALAWMMLGMDTLSRWLGFRQRPAWTYSVEQNAMQYAILLFLVLPQIVSQFSASGAFELVLDEQTKIFSKLSSGRFPTQEELINGLQAHGLKLAS